MEKDPLWSKAVGAHMWVGGKGPSLKRVELLAFWEFKWIYRQREEEERGRNTIQLKTGFDYLFTF